MDQACCLSTPSVKDWIGCSNSSNDGFISPFLDIIKHQEREKFDWWMQRFPFPGDQNDFCHLLMLAVSRNGEAWGALNKEQAKKRETSFLPRLLEITHHALGVKEVKRFIVDTNDTLSSIAVKRLDNSSVSKDELNALAFFATRYGHANALHELLSMGACANQSPTSCLDIINRLNGDPEESELELARGLIAVALGTESNDGKETIFQDLHSTQHALNLIHVLLQHKADPNLSRSLLWIDNECTPTPLTHNPYPSPTLIQALLEGGLDPYLKDDQGQYSTVPLVSMEREKRELIANSSPLLRPTPSPLKPRQRRT